MRRWFERALMTACQLFSATACEAEDIACLQSGNACVWLGTGAEGFNGDGHDRLDTEIYWSMDMAFGQDGTPWFIDWNNHLLRKVKPDQTVETVVGWTDPIFPGDGTGDASEKTEPGADGLRVKLNHPTELVVADQSPDPPGPSIVRLLELRDQCN